MKKLCGSLLPFFRSVLFRQTEGSRQRGTRLFTQKARKTRFSEWCASRTTVAIERVATVQKVIFNVVGLYNLDLSSVFGKYIPPAVSFPPLFIPPPPSETSHRVVRWRRAIGSYR